MTEDEKKSIEDAIEELKKVKDGDDKDAIEAAIEKLSQVAHKLAEEIYKDAQAKQNGGTNPENPQNEDVAEAEIVD